MFAELVANTDDRKRKVAAVVCDLCACVQVLASILTYIDNPADVANSALVCQRTHVVASRAPLRLRLQPAGSISARVQLRGILGSFKGDVLFKCLQISALVRIGKVRSFRCYRYETTGGVIPAALYYDVLSAKVSS